MSTVDALAKERLEKMTVDRIDDICELRNGVNVVVRSTVTLVPKRGVKLTKL